MMKILIGTYVSMTIWTPLIWDSWVSHGECDAAHQLEWKQPKQCLSLPFAIVAHQFQANFWLPPEEVVNVVHNEFNSNGFECFNRDTHTNYYFHKLNHIMLKHMSQLNIFLSVHNKHIVSHLFNLRNLYLQRFSE